MFWISVSFWVASTKFHSGRCLPSMVSFLYRSFLVSCKPTCLFVFAACVLGIWPPKTLCLEVSLLFSSARLIQVFDPLCGDFYVWWRKWPNLIFQHIDIQFFQHCLFGRMFFLWCVFLLTFPRIQVSLWALYHVPLIYQHHDILVTIALEYVLGSGITIPPVSSLLHKILSRSSMLPNEL